MTTDRMPPDRLARPLVIDIAIDVNALHEMARFYEALFLYERAWDRPGHVYLIDPSGRGPHIYLQQVPEPRTTKNRLHLDIVVPSLHDAVAHAVALGATRVEERRTAFTWFEVLADPEGNLFCLVDLETWQQSKPPWWQHTHD